MHKGRLYLTVGLHAQFNTFSSAISPRDTVTAHWPVSVTSQFQKEHRGDSLLTSFCTWKPICTILCFSGVIKLIQQNMLQSANSWLFYHCWFIWGILVGLHWLSSSSSLPTEGFVFRVKNQKDAWNMLSLFISFCWSDANSIIIFWLRNKQPMNLLRSVHSANENVCNWHFIAIQRRVFFNGIDWKT